MALTNCPDCNRKVSSNAVSCPGCGRSMAGSTVGSERTIELRFIMTLGSRIRYVRGALRQDEFAKRLGATRNTVSLWECNVAMPGVDLLLRMYEEFNVNLNWLLSSKGDAYRSKNE